MFFVCIVTCPGMAGISASSLLLRISATVRSLIPLRTLRAVDGAGSPCPRADLRGSQREGPPWVESGCGAVAVGQACLLPPLSSGGALVARPWLRFHIPLIEPDMRISLHPALGQDVTPSPTAGRVQAGSDARARGSRRGARVDSYRPCFVWSCA